MGYWQHREQTEDEHKDEHKDEDEDEDEQETRTREGVNMRTMQRVAPRHVGGVFLCRS